MRWKTFAQSVGFALAALFIGVAGLLSNDADAAAVCAAPGRDTLPGSGIINSYWGGQSATSSGGGNATVTLGNQRTGSANTPFGTSAVPSTGISAGDLLIIMQTQGANAGAYEYVTVVAPAGPVTSGSITVKGTGNNGALLNTYTQNFSSGSTFQIIRVPQTLNASLSGNYSSAPWDVDASGYGTGGVFALDTAQTASLGGTIDVSGQGFRGGAAFNQVGNSAAITSTTPAYPSNSTTGASKGEGTAGTPGYVFDGFGTVIKQYSTTGLNNAAYAAATPAASPSFDGNYSAGSFGLGANGNAGGGGNDAKPNGGANQYNSGGAGGGNAGRGGQGGWTWVGSAAYCAPVGFTPTQCPFNTTVSAGITDAGGRGGLAIGGLSAGTVTLGGGGGSGSVNNNGLAVSVTTYPPIDVAVDPTTLSGGSATSGNGAQGAISGSGARGGGIVLIRAGTFLAGAGQINANGIRAYNQYGGSEAGGGGGAGGVIMVLTQAASGTLNASAVGGRGGDSNYFSHGPGGGGGGGYVLTNFSVNATVDKGGGGYTPNIGNPPAQYTFPNHYGTDSVDGLPGYVSTAGGTTPGASSGSACSPDVAATVTLPASAAAGAAVAGTFRFTDNGPSDSIGVGYAATLTAGLPATGAGAVSFGTITLNGVAVAGATATYNSASGAITFTGLPTTLPNGQTLQVPVNFTMPANGTSVTGTDSVAESTTDPVPSNNSGTATTAGAPTADDATSITGLPASANPNAAIFGIINFVNNGPTVSNGVTYAAKVPPGSTVTAIRYNGTAIAGAGATVGADGTITFTGTALPTALNPNDTVTVSFNATMPANGSSVLSSSSIASTTTDPNTSNNSASVTVTGTGSADLLTSITGLPTGTQAANAPLSGRITFQNNGPGTALTPTYTVQVPPGSSITSAQVKYNGTPINGVTVTIDQNGNVTFGGAGLPGALNSGDVVTIDFNGAMPANGSNANVLSSISSPTADPNLGNNNASVSVPGSQSADLFSSVTGLVTFAQPGGTNENGTITFGDNGPSAGTGIAYTTTLTSGLTSVTLGTPQLNGAAIAGATATYNSAAGTVTYTGLPATLNSGDKITVALAFTTPPAATAASVTVATNIQGNVADPVPSNNAASVTVPGGSDPATTITGYATTNQAAGRTENGVLNFTNQSGATAVGLTYTATMTTGLAGVTLGTPALNGTAITGATATYSITTGTITFTGLPTSLAAGSTITIADRFTMPASDVVLNTSIASSPSTDISAANNNATVTVPSASANSDMTVGITGLGGTATPNAAVSTGQLNFSNNTTTAAATGVAYSATLPVGATVTGITQGGTTVAGASASVAANGTVTFTGMPTTVTNAAPVVVSFSFPMPANGSNATARAQVTSSNDTNLNNNSAVATEFGAPPTDLQATVTEPASAAPGASISGTVHYLDNGPSAANGVTVALTLPVAGGTPTITSVMLNGSLLTVSTSIAPNGVVTFTGLPSTLSSGDDLAVAFTAKMPANGSSISTTAQISYPGSDTVPANNTATATTAGNPNAPIVSVTKTVDQTSHNTGDTVTWQLHVTNTGTGPTTGVITLTDTLPASNISNVVVTPTGASCSPSSPTAGTTLTCTIPAGLAGTNGVANVQIQATLQAAGTYNNAVSPSGNATDNPTCAPNACSTVTVVGSATMQVVETSVHGVGTFGYTLTNMSAASDSITTTTPGTSASGVINVVTSPTTAITINQSSSPAGYGITSASCVDTNASVTGNTGTFGTLSGTTLTVAPANIKANSVLKCSFVNTVTESMGIAKTGPTTMTVGNNVNYTIKVTNLSATIPVTAATVSDVLPASLTFVSAGGVGWTCSAAGQNISCTYSGAAIATSGSSTITVVATPTAVSAGVTNFASIDPTGGTAPPTPGAACTPAADCAASASAPVTGQGLSISKSAPTPALRTGTNSSYTLTITNNGAAAATAATVRDQLPPSLAYVNATGTGWTCSNASGLISCTYAGSIAAGGTSTITVTVATASNAAVGGSLTNYASIDPTGGTAPPAPGASCTPASSCTSQTSTVTGPNVAVTKTVDQANHAVGDTVVWTLKASNTGAYATAAAITLTDTLPSTISGITFTPSSGVTCAPAPVAGGTVTCTVPAGLAANTGVATVTIRATATAAGTLTNTVTASGADNPICAAGACSASTSVGGQALTLSKALSGNRVANSDQFTVQIKNGASVVASATTNGSGGTVAGGSTGETAVSAGTPYSLTEIAAGTTSLAQYSAALACTNANGASTTVLPTVVGGTVTPAAGDRISCVITNSSQPVVNLTKALGSGRVHNTDQFTVQIANGATVVASATTTGSGSALGANSTGVTALTAGTTYTIGEVAAGTTSLAQYASTLNCTNATTGSTTVLPSTVGGNLTPAAGDNISCTLTNSTKGPQVTFLANLTGARAANTDQFTLQINNGATAVATTTTTGTGSTLANNSTGPTPVNSGVTYSLAEVAAGSTNLNQYTSTLACVNSDTSSTTTLPTTLPGNITPNVGDAVICTVSIAPKANADLSIQITAPPVVAPDGALTYTLTIANNGPGPANNASFADTLPASLGTATASCVTLAGGAVCGPVTVNGHVVSGTLTTLPSGASAVVTITTTGPASGSVTDTATVSAPAGITDPVLANNSSSVTTNVGAVPSVVDLSVTQAGTTAVVVGGGVVYDVDVVNGGPAGANGAVFGYSAAPVITGVTWTCAAIGGGAVCPAAAGTGNIINQTIATFPDGGHLLYVVRGTAPAAPQQYVNTATITAPSGDTDPNPANNTAVVTTNVQGGAAPQADIAVTLTGTTTAAPGAPVTYSVVVTNNGPSGANGTTLAAPVPGVVTNVTTTCVASGGAVCPSVAPGNNVNAVIPTLPSGGFLTFTITGTAPASGSFSESASVTPPVGLSDPVPANNVAGPVVTTVPALSADLSIQKNGPAQVLANGIINYTLVVSNAGPNAADGAVITDNLPTTLSAISAVCSAATGGATCGAVAVAGTTLTGSVATLPVAGSVTISVSARAPASGSLSNSAAVATPTGVADPNPANNTAGPVQTTIVTSVPSQADLSVVVAGPSTVAPGGVLTYVVTVANAGPAAGNGAVFSDVLPAGLANVQAVCGGAIGGAVCGPVGVTGTSITSAVAALPAGGALTFTIQATAPPAGSVIDTASIGAAPNTTDPNLSNNTGRAATTIGAVTGSANLGVSKTGPDTAGAGSDFSYSIIVTNAGPGAADGALVSDSIPSGLTNIRAACSNPTNGAVCGPVQVTGGTVSSNVTRLPALGTVTLTVTVTAPIPSGLQPTSVVNRASVTPPAGIVDPDTSDNLSGAVETAIVSAGVSGTVWLDLNHDRRLDAGDPLLAGWIVELFHNGVLVSSTTTNASGQYSFTGVAPGPGYSIDFRDPGTRAIYGTPTNGDQGTPNPDSNAVIANGIIQSLTLKPGINIVQQSLPVDPTGVVYDAVARTAVGGATVTLIGPPGFNPATELVGGASNATQVVPSGGASTGLYQFLLINPGLPGGAPAGVYTLQVTPPAGYLPPPAKSGGVSAPGPTFIVPGPTSASTAVQAQLGPPPPGTRGPATTYYLSLDFVAGSGSVVNNNIPLDRIAGGALTVQKSGNTNAADIGETVLYTVDITSNVGQIPDVILTDRLPRGFVLIPGTVTINGARAPDPKISTGSDLSFAIGTVASGQTVEVKYRVRVGVGAQQGDGVNRAQASNPLGASSNVATFKVDVNGGVFTTNACVVGKVYVDCNGNRIQDEHELGIPGVRLYFSDGTFVISDSEGKYSYCGLRPTTHTLKVDQTTLPPGSHLVESSNRNALDPGSLFVDLKNGELHQADFIEGSCSPQVIDGVKARRSIGEVNGPQREKSGPALIFDSRLPGANAPPDSGPSKDAPAAKDGAP